MLTRQAGTFLVVGVLTVLIDGLTYRALQGVLQHVLPWLWPQAGHNALLMVAKAGGFLTGMGFAYVANRFVTFRQQSDGKGTASRFMLLYGLALLLNISLNSLTVLALSNLAPSMAAHWGVTMDAGVQLTLAFLVATAASATWNFVGMKWFVFRGSTVLP